MIAYQNPWQERSYGSGLRQVNIYISMELLTEEILTKRLQRIIGCFYQIPKVILQLHYAGKCKVRIDLKNYFKIWITSILLIYLCLRGPYMGLGEVTEWSKVLAWKVSVPHKGTKGSNPFLSAQHSR